MRLFIAVLLDEPTRAALAAQIDRLRQTAPGVAWVQPANLHLTLKFLGTVANPLIQPVREALGVAADLAGAFDLAVEGLGAFPAVTRPRVIWAGAEEGQAAATALAGRVEAALAPLGFPAETRPFSAHITLGRVREPRRDQALARLIEDGARVRFGLVRVGAVSLMRSQLSPRGARYSEISAAPLAGS